MSCKKLIECLSVDFSRALIVPAMLAVGGALAEGSRLGIDRAHYGVWDRTSFHNGEDYPFTTGQSFSEVWRNVHVARGVYDWSWLDEALQYAYEQGHKCYIKIQPVNGGLSHPDWLGDEGVPTFTDGVNTYGYYLDPTFKEIFAEMVMAFGNYVRNEVPPHLRGVVAWCRVESGRSGDEVPYSEHDDVPEQYKIPYEDWKAYKLWVYELYDQAFQEGEGYVVPLLFNAIHPHKQPDIWAWCVENVTGGLGTKYGGSVRGHHLNTSAGVAVSYKDLAEDNAMGLFSRNEMDQTWQYPYFQTNIRMAMFWTAVEQLHPGMSVWDVTGSALTRVYENDYAFAFEFFDRWAAELVPETAGGGFCIFHEGLDSADTVKFPEETYGKAGQGNEDRYEAICAAYAHRGARMDDLEGATRGQLNQRKSQTGLNDAGWLIVPGNYERFITQIDPDATSIGLWRVGGTITTNSHPYDRFARGFEHATGRNEMYFDVRDNLCDEPGQAVKLLIHYYDDGVGRFSLKYDAKGNSANTAFTVTKTDSKTWKSASATVTDWVFGNNGPRGADLVLVNEDEEDDVFHRIELLKLCDVNIGTTGRGTVEASHGLNTLNPMAEEHMEGYELDLKAVPEQGWEFTGWSGDAAGELDSFKLFPTSDTRATAHFEFTGRFYGRDDFDTVDLSGGTGWAGDWILEAPMEWHTNQANATIRLYSNARMTRTLAVPVSDAVLRFKSDQDKLDDSGDSVRAEVYNGSWHVVWEVNESGESGFRNNSYPNMWLEEIDLSAYGEVSKVRFIAEIDGGESLWLDNVEIHGYAANGANDACYFTSDPLGASNALVNVPFMDSIASAARDPNGDSMMFSKVSGPDWLSVSADGALSGIPAVEHKGLNAFRVRVEDADGSAEASLLIRVAETNMAPVFVSDPVFKPEGTSGFSYAETLKGGAYDPNLSDTLTYSKTSGPDWLNVATDGSIGGIPLIEDEGTNTFTVRATDPFGAFGEATLRILVEAFSPDGTLALTPTDDVWVTESTPGASMGSSSTLRVGSNAARESFLRFDTGTIPGRIVSARLKLYSLNVEQTVHCNAIADTTWNEESVDYGNRPSMGETIDTVDVVAGAWHEFDVSTYVTNDGVYAFGLEGTANNKDFESKEGVNKPELLIEYVNTRPIFSPKWFSAPDAGTGRLYAESIASAAVDAENDELVYSIIGGPGWLNVAADGTLSGVPDEDDVGENAFVVEVKDPALLTDTATMYVNVLDLPNAAPTFESERLSKPDAIQAEAYYDSLANDVVDPDVKDTLTFVKEGGPSWLAVASNGAISGTPSSADVGLNLFTITVSDDGTPSMSSSVELRVMVDFAPSGELRFEPTDDAWVSSSSTKLGANYGSHEQLRVGKEAAREAYLKFNVSGGLLGDVSSAVLRLYSQNVQQTVRCNAIEDVAWNESDVVYSNRPSMGATIVSVDVETNAWHEFDVTSYVRDNGIYAFGLEGTGPNKNFESKEGVNKPELIVRFGGVSSRYGSWAAQWDLAVGTETNDVDGDGWNNLLEYAFNGDPANSNAVGGAPVLETHSDELRFIHLMRNDDPTLVYVLESTTNLTSGVWDDASHTVLGTNERGGGLKYDVITNALPTVLDGNFIRLRISN